MVVTRGGEYTSLTSGRSGPLLLERMTLPLVLPSPPEPTDHLLISAILDDVAAILDDVPEPTDH
eukprot:16444388-Heterocapsa_arctica.AAC.1